MINFFDWLKRHSRPALLTITGFSIFIVFESFQQLFYIENFNNGVPVSVGFWEVLQGGIYRWIIWLVVAVPFVLTVSRFPSSGLSKRDLIRQIALVMVALLLNLLILSVSHASVRNGAWFNFPEVFEYFFFHKAPIILVSLVFLVILVYYFKSRTVLEVTIKRVGELQKTNADLFDQVAKDQLNNESLIFEVKTGNRIQLLSEKAILWIAADDYCVRMHTIEGDSHIMRTSLKALESKLEDHKFLRVHRKAIVNLECIKSYRLGQSPVVVLNDDTEVPIAQSRLRAFKDQFQPI